MLKINPKIVVKEISNFLKEYAIKANGFVLGLSGGIDSTVTAYLCAKVINPNNVLALIMPDPEVTPKNDVEDAINVAKTLSFQYRIIDISKILNAFSLSIPDFSNKALVAVGNLRARIRMCLLYYYANLMNRIVVGTGDKSEILIGYFTKYGDGGVDILPLGDLYKTQVRMLGKYLGVPGEILKKPSSPRLWKDQLAEEELGLSYDIIDPILYYLIDLKLNEIEISRKLNLPIEVILKVKRMIDRSRHKRELPPIAKLPPEAFEYEK